MAKGGDGSGRTQGRRVRRRPFGSRVETLWPFADVGRARWRGEDAAGDTLGPGWREFAGRLGSLVDGSGAVRQEMAGLATERGRG